MTRNSYVWKRDNSRRKARSSHFITPDFPVVKPFEFQPDRAGSSGTSHTNDPAKLIIDCNVDFILKSILRSFKVYVHHTNGELPI